MGQEKKIKVLALADSPVSATGFAQVSRNILNRLAATGKYEFHVLGINHTGDQYDRAKFPYNIYMAQPLGSNDQYGRFRFINALKGGDINSQLKPPFDLLFTIQDSFVIEGLGTNFGLANQLRVDKETWKRSLPPEFWFKWIGYFPVDSELKENWITRSIALPDYPVAYCDWGKKEIMKYDRDNFEVNFISKLPDGTTQSGIVNVPSMEDRIQVINHGVDLNDFHVISDEERMKFREEFFGGVVKPDTFLVTNISRNQPRKDIMRTIQVFSEFLKYNPNSHLYLHMQSHDIGGSIEEMARYFGLSAGKEYTVPNNFDAGAGYGIDIVNKIYNAADACITTTLGEGWGFISTEAMATKTPLVAPNITSFIDILGANVPMLELNKWLEDGGWDQVRGIPVLAGSTRSEWFSQGIQDNERLRPLTNVDDMVSKLRWVKENPETVNKIVERAYEWVQNLSWDKIAEHWDSLFMRAYAELEEERKLGDKIDKVGRNEPCPCGSGKKFKNCHGSAEAIKKMEGLLK